MIEMSPKAAWRLAGTACMAVGFASTKSPTSWRYPHQRKMANDTGTPGRDHLPWPEFVAAMRDHPYDGPVVIESFVPQFEKSLARFRFGGRSRGFDLAAARAEPRRDGQGRLGFLKTAFAG
jgi:sugar phosphate isomerase/epimerase